MLFLYYKCDAKILIFPFKTKHCDDLLSIFSNGVKPQPYVVTALYTDVPKGGLEHMARQLSPHARSMLAACIAST